MPYDGSEVEQHQTVNDSRSPEMSKSSADPVWEAIHQEAAEEAAREAHSRQFPAFHHPHPHQPGIRPQLSPGQQAG